MKYRKLDANGDYVIGLQQGDFYTNTPEAVAQAVQTRLGLRQGEWFLDTTVGTPYDSQILGAGKVASYDYAIQAVILGTQGVNQITAYSSNVDPTTRAATVQCTIDTIYGQTALSVAV